MNLRHFHWLLAGIATLAAAQVRAASHPAGRVVYRSNETVTLIKCNVPDMPANKTNYTRTGYLGLDGQVTVENWVRVLSEIEDPMEEGAPLAPDALALPTVLPARSWTNHNTNTIDFFRREPFRLLALARRGI